MPSAHRPALFKAKVAHAGEGCPAVPSWQGQQRCPSPWVKPTPPSALRAGQLTMLISQLFHFSSKVCHISLLPSSPSHQEMVSVSPLGVFCCCQDPCPHPCLLPSFSSCLCFRRGLSNAVPVGSPLHSITAKFLISGSKTKEMKKLQHLMNGM